MLFVKMARCDFSRSTPSRSLAKVKFGNLAEDFCNLPSLLNEGRVVPRIRVETSTP